MSEQARTSGTEHDHDGAGTPGTVAELPLVLTVQELAGVLRLHTNQVYAAIQRGDIPGVRRVGGTYRISRDRVLEWLDGGTGQVEPVKPTRERRRA